MLKILFLIFALIIAPHYLHAAPGVIDKSAEATALEDRIHQRSREIATMNAYSARLRGILRHGGFPSDELVRKLSFEQKMNRAIPAVHCDGTRFIDALTALSRAALVEITVDWKSLAEAGIDKDALITCDVRNRTAHVALGKILEAAGGASTKAVYIVKDDRVMVTTVEQANKNSLTRVYDITAILPRNTNLPHAQELLAKILVDTVSPETWVDAGGSVGTVSFKGGTMIVTQTPANLGAVETLLEQLDINRENAHSRATIEQQEIETVALGAEINRLVARCRALGIAVPPRLDQAMNMELSDIDFIGLPLAACFASLQSESGQLIDVNWKALEESGIDRRRPITLSLHRQTLAAALQSLVENGSEGNVTLQYAVEGNTVAVSTQEGFDRSTATTRVYDIRGVPSHGRTREEAVDNIILALTSTIDPDSWRDNGGAVGSVRELQGMLIVTHSERTQARIKAYLDSLRHQVSSRKGLGD